MALPSATVLWTASITFRLAQNMVVLFFLAALLAAPARSSSPSSNNGAGLQQPTLTLCSGHSTVAKSGEFASFLAAVCAGAYGGGVAHMSHSMSSYVAAENRTMYGVAQCRPDVSASDCTACLAAASSKLITGTACATSAVWHDACFLRYSDRDTGRFREDEHTETVFNASRALSSLPPHVGANKAVVVRRLLAAVADSTRSGHMCSDIGVGTGAAGGGRIYGLTRCAAEISCADCRRCLGGALAVVEREYNGSAGMQVLRLSCMARYESYPFYNTKFLTRRLLASATSGSPRPTHGGIVFNSSISFGPFGLVHSGGPNPPPSPPVSPPPPAFTTISVPASVGTAQPTPPPSRPAQAQPSPPPPAASMIVSGPATATPRAAQAQPTPAPPGGHNPPPASPPPASIMNISGPATATPTPRAAQPTPAPPGGPTPQPVAAATNENKGKGTLNTPKWQIVSIATGLVAAFIILALTVWCRRKQQLSQREHVIEPHVLNHQADGVPGETMHHLEKKHLGSEEDDDGGRTSCQLYSYLVLEAATCRFSSRNKLGSGGFGTVYKGTLENGKDVAVKRLRDSKRAIQELEREISIVASLRHKNIVRFLGYCFQEEGRFFIYEYVLNNSLDKFWYKASSQCQKLEWATWFNIILGVARGLLFLHDMGIIHRDLKPHNILLDRNFNPKIADFDLMRMYDQQKTHESTEKVAGTFGYMAPECTSGRKFLLSIKSDVYSYGVLVLEIITGHKIYTFEGQNSEGLVEYVWQHWSTG
uniref:non-specific serine/threonine protein kinase n=2 Tax=Zea mays TaxID=4577 RepID=A0A804REK3_MAIZE